jgi:hypothetical protein
VEVEEEEKVNSIMKNFVGKTAKFSMYILWMNVCPLDCIVR